MSKNDIEIQREIYSLIKEPFEVFDKFIYYDYAFITENYKAYIGKFKKQDFLHLIGISVYPMDSRKFYDNYKDGKTNYSLINMKKTYNRSTIIKKITVIKNLQNFVENNLDGENLVIEDFRTLTAENEVFEYALRNDDKRFTLGFGKYNNAKTTRLELATIGATRQRVICVLRKKRDCDEFNELVYLKSNISIQSVIANLITPHQITSKGNLLIS